MKTLKITLSLMVLAVLVLGTSCTLFKRSGRARVHTLMFTGNYLDSRLLAELAQYKTKQPIIFVESDGAGEQLFLLPTFGSQAEQISKSDLLDVVAFLNPKRVAFLGDSSYVPAEYISMLQGKFEVITFASSDWSNNAQGLGALLNQSRLKYDFDTTKAKYLQAVGK